MTDRHKGYIVTLNADVRQDDAEDIITAIKMVSGVAQVKPLVADYDAHIAEERARLKLVKALWEVLK